LPGRLVRGSIGVRLLPWSLVTHSVTESMHIVCAGAGLDVSAESVPYVAGWGQEDALAAVHLFAGPLETVAGRAGGELVERLALAPTWAARFALLDAEIAARVAASAPPPREVAWAWSRLAATDGAVPVGALAQQLGWSRKRLVGRFREHVGLAPKLYARLLRFQAAVELLWIALDCGYYDQAHLNRDFRAFADVTPSEFVASRLPGEAGFAEGNSVQDVAALAA
jgi:AraC-like DNA-binding protein